MSTIKNIMESMINSVKEKNAILLFTGDKGSALLMRILKDLNVSAIFIDTGYHFSEISAYIKSIDGRVDVIRNDNADAEPSEGMDACCAQRKSGVLKHFLDQSDTECLIVPFMDDDRECGIEDSYLNGVDGVDIIRPLAGLSWKDIWKMIKEEGIPFSFIYNKGYAIVDCSCCTTRHGRRKEAEHIRDKKLERETEEKLKDLGYM